MEFKYTSKRISRGEVPKSWNAEGPVPLSDLRLLNLQHYDLDFKVQQGELVVHKDVVNEVVIIFSELFYNKFPIAKMKLVDHYNADDEASMSDNNTYSFCSRKSTGAEKWSIHAYGRAIDINPLFNPYIKGEVILPKSGINYVDRTKTETPGMIHHGSKIYEIFRKYGWVWGGDWNSLKDYHHFQKDESVKNVQFHLHLLLILRSAHF